MLSRVRQPESANATDAVPERWGDIFLPIGGEDREAGIDLHMSQQVSQRDVGLSIVTDIHFNALAEKGIGLVKQQDGTATCCGTEQALEILFGLSDVFADHTGEIDLIQVELELIGDDLCRQGLAGPARTREKRADAKPARTCLHKTPGPVPAKYSLEVSVQPTVAVPLIEKTPH